MNRREGLIETEKLLENSHAGYVCMEDLFEKLKALDYDQECATELKLKPIHRYYFMVQKNPGEQFYLFCCIAAWLIRKCGAVFDQPQEYDDPNTTIANILEKVRANKVVIDFPPNRLKQGYGDNVVFVLNQLADAALEHNNFRWKKPQPPEELDEEAEIIEDESELHLDQVEDEMMAYYSDDDDDNEAAFSFNNRAKSFSKKTNEEMPLEHNIDEEAWQLELERVLPRLKVTVVGHSNRDWRSRLEQMKQHRDTIDKTLVGTKSALEKMHKNVTNVMEVVASRERYLNRELEAELAEFRVAQDELSKVKDAYRSISSGVTERNRKLEQLNIKVESLKREMDERGNSMTDGTPLVKIKKAITQVKSEIAQMDIKIGVLQCLLLQTKVQEKKSLEDDLGQSIHAF